MKPNDYFHKEDISQLTEVEYESVRAYLQLMGFRCTNEYGIYDGCQRRVNMCVTLFQDGDLCWCARYPRRGGKRIPLSEMKRMAQLGMVE